MLETRAELIYPCEAILAAARVFPFPFRGSLKIVLSLLRAAEIGAGLRYVLGCHFHIFATIAP